MWSKPYLIIQRLCKYFSCIWINFKTPKCAGNVSNKQKELLRLYEENRFKCINSKDYSLIMKEVNHLMKDVRVKCMDCKREITSPMAQQQKNKINKGRNSGIN